MIPLGLLLDYLEIKCESKIFSKNYELLSNNTAIFQMLVET
jgi:hypothetical protein